MRDQKRARCDLYVFMKLLFVTIFMWSYYKYKELLELIKLIEYDTGSWLLILVRFYI